MISINLSLNEQVEEAATIRPDILYFFGQGLFIFIREILKMEACGNHVYMYFYAPNEIVIFC